MQPLEKFLLELCASKGGRSILNGEHESFNLQEFDTSNFTKLEDQSWFGKSDSRKSFLALPPNSIILPTKEKNVLYWKKDTQEWYYSETSRKN